MVEGPSHSVASNRTKPAAPARPKRPKTQRNVGRFRHQQRGLENHRRDRPGGAFHRHQLRIPGHHRPDRIPAQSEGAGADVVGLRPLPVHRPDLARHPEEGRAGARARPICRTPSARPRTGAIPSPIPTCAPTIMQLRHDPSASALMAGAFTRNNETQLASRHRPAAERGRALHRAFPRLGRRRQADLGRRQSAAGQRRRDVPARGARQPQRVLRPRRPQPQRCRGLWRAQQALPDGAHHGLQHGPPARHHRSADRRHRQTCLDCRCSIGVHAARRARAPAARRRRLPRLQQAGGEPVRAAQAIAAMRGAIRRRRCPPNWHASTRVIAAATQAVAAAASKAAGAAAADRQATACRCSGPCSATAPARR